MKLDFFEHFKENLDKVSDHVAFQRLTPDGKETISYAQLDQEIRKLSFYLKSQGVAPGDAVGILMENHPRWVCAFFAGQSAGGVLVPLDTLHTPEVLAKLIRHSECKFLFCSAAQLPALKKIQSLRDAPIPVLVNGDSQGEYPEWDQVIAQVNEPSIPLPLVDRSMESPLLVMYTSGTTGSPKGVVLRGDSLFENVDGLMELFGVGPKDGFLNVLPLYHILALSVNCVAALYCGARVTFLDVLDASKILQAFREERISIFVSVPQFYYMLYRKIQQEIKRQSRLKQFLFRRLLALSNLSNEHLNWNPGKLFFPALHRQFGEAFRLFGVGGARFDVEVARGLRDLGFGLVQAYGMTETAAVATVTPPGSKGTGSVGRPLPHVSLRIAEADEKGIGEVLIKGSNIMVGYLKDVAATREAIDEEGWLHSGDLGYLSKEGFLHITGRKKDVIVLSSGKNIFPEEIEQFYQSNCELIKEICVIGVSDAGAESGQEHLHAVVVPDFDQVKKQNIVNVYDMIRYLFENLSQRLPSHKRVHSFEIRREPLPRTTTKKIRRFELQAECETRTSPDSAAPEAAWEPESPVERALLELIQGVKKGANPYPEANLELDLGFDSLERVELLSNVQHNLQVTIADEEAVELFTVQDVIDLVSQRLLQNGEALERRQQSWSEILSEPLGESEKVMLAERLRPRPFVEALFVFLARLTRVLVKVLFRLKGEGLENLPREYPFMLCPNHLSFLDAFMVVALLPPRVIRRWYSLGYSDYFTRGIAGYLGQLVKTIPVDSDLHLRQALRLAAEGLRRSLILCVFPEGERAIDGKLKPFRKGPAILAVEIGVPVVPVGIVGTYEAWRRGSGKIRLHPVHVRFGEPIRPREGESADEFNSRLYEAVQRLL